MELHFAGISLDNLKVGSRAVVQNEDIRIVHTDFRKKEKLFSYVRHGSESHPKTVSAFSKLALKFSSNGHNIESYNYLSLYYRDFKIVHLF